ncbi:hypothetical protein F5B20DRAFT_549671 [Whalleya microplaca]|nr:hypothetical protein F5B20DRAFT_549671 [Whalleya microplaca]
MTTFTAEGKWRGNILLTVIHDWPSKCDHATSTNTEWGRYTASSNIHTNHAVPAYWASALLCEKYWEEVVTVYRSTAFRIPRILSSRSENQAGFHITQSARRMAQLQNMVPELAKEYDMFNWRWQSRKALWQTIRSPWYSVQYRDWECLPWSNISGRTLVDQFIYFHATRNLTQCRAIALMLIKHQEQRYREYYDNTTNGWDHELPSETIYYILSLLMLSSLPWVYPNQPKVVPLPYDTHLAIKKLILPIHNFPSIEAREWFTGDSIGPYTISSSSPEPDLTTFFPPRWQSQNHILIYCTKILLACEMRNGGSVPWLTSIIKSILQIKAEREHIRPWEWASFPFTIPPYTEGWAVATGYGLNLRTPFEWRYFPVLPGGPFVIPAYHSPPGSPVMSAPPPPSGVARGSNTRRGSVPSRNSIYPRHLPISEVCNHRSLADAWVVESDGVAGFDIYNISDVLKERNATDNDYSAIVKLGSWGPYLVSSDDRADLIRNQFKNSIQPVGKLMLGKRPEEISECNGQVNGMPAWIVSGTQVYDITNFPFQSAEERAELMQYAGGPLPDPLSTSDPRQADLLNRLGPYACAYVAHANNEGISTPTHFTLQMLRWHDNPDLGCYIAIAGIVYDITSYMPLHPGGDRLLIEYAGRDATEAFMQYHSPELINGYRRLAVGRLVPEIQRSDITQDQIAVHDWVFNIAGLGNEKNGYYGALRDYVGTDATESIKIGQAGSDVLVTMFLEEKDRIVAKLAGPPLPDIPEGELKNHDDPSSVEGAWVVVGNLVLNATRIMLYPNFYGRQIPTGFAGRVLEDAELANWLSTNFPERCIGRLVPGPAWGKPIMDFEEPEEPHPDGIPVVTEWV